MDDQTARKLLVRIQGAAKSYGFRDHKEDIAQEVILNMLINPSKRQLINRATIDAIRTLFGRASTQVHATRKAIRDATSEIDIAAPQMSEKDFHRFIKPFTGMERAILCLKYVWGFLDHEIAYCFGYTEPRINQKFKELKELLSRQLNADPMRKRVNLPIDDMHMINLLTNTIDSLVAENRELKQALSKLTLMVKKK